MRSWDLPIGRWAVWEDGSGTDIKASLAAIDPMLRRRLSPLARGAIHVAAECGAGIDSLRFVFASRHGELARTVEALHCLHRNEPISPTTFSLSVLNSAAGVFSIARNDRKPTTAVSAGIETFGYGLMEAYARFQADPSEPVLVVYADAAALEPIGRQANDPPRPFALGMLIAPQAAATLTTAVSAGQADRSAEPQAFACRAALQGTAAAWSSGANTWSWELR